MCAFWQKIKAINRMLFVPHMLEIYHSKLPILHFWKKNCVAFNRFWVWFCALITGKLWIDFNETLFYCSKRALKGYKLLGIDKQVLWIKWRTLKLMLWLVVILIPLSSCTVALLCYGTKCTCAFSSTAAKIVVSTSFNPKDSRNANQLT